MVTTGAVMTGAVTIGAVVAAAGMSSRMKAFKPMLPLAGSSMIRTALATLKSAGVSTIVVVTGNRAGHLMEHLADMDVVFVHNEDYARTDMYQSACLGLRRIHGKTDRVFFLPADVPLFARRSLLAMMEHMDRIHCDILVPTHMGVRGHPLLLEDRVIPALLSYSGEDGLRGAVEAYAGVKAVLEVPDMGTTIDADRPEDYELLRRYARDRRE